MSACVCLCCSCFSVAMGDCAIFVESSNDARWKISRAEKEGELKSSKDHCRLSSSRLPPSYSKAKNPYGEPGCRLIASVNRFSSYGFRRTFSVIFRRNPQIVCKCSTFRFLWTLYAFILPLFCFAFPSFVCVILLSETYLYAVYFDEPGLKTLKITNRFSGYNE